MNQNVAETISGDGDACLKQYRVRWEIDVEASSPEEAARSARATQLRTDSIADVFEVREVDGTVVSPGCQTVDLSEIDERYVDAAA